MNFLLLKVYYLIKTFRKQKKLNKFKKIALINDAKTENNKY